MSETQRYIFNFLNSRNFFVKYSVKHQCGRRTLLVVCGVVFLFMVLVMYVLTMCLVIVVMMVFVLMVASSDIILNLFCYLSNIRHQMLHVVHGALFVPQQPPFHQLFPKGFASRMRLQVFLSLVCRKCQQRMLQYYIFKLLQCYRVWVILCDQVDGVL